MKRLVIFMDEVRILMQCSRTSAYELIASIRATHPGSARLPKGRVLVKDFAEYHDLTLEEVWEALTDDGTTID